jgi:hypothetical protein
MLYSTFYAMEEVNMDERVWTTAFSECTRLMARAARTGLTLFALTWAFPASARDDVSTYPQCQAGRLQCVHHVIQEMNRRYKKLARNCDHDAIFALVYLRTTEKYQATAQTLGYEDVSRVTREDSVFADYYLRAYDAYHDGASVPPAWQIAFDAAENGTVSVVGDAFLGINAHIQRDLAFTLYDIYVGGDPVSKHDHDLVNVFLAQVDVAEEIMAQYDPSYPTSGDPNLIPAWREQAWQNFVALRDAPDATARAAVASQIEAVSAAYAQQFAQIFAIPLAAAQARDAYCEAN